MCACLFLPPLCHCSCGMASPHKNKDRYCIKWKHLCMTNRICPHLISLPHIFTALWSVTCRIRVLPFMFEDLRRGERQVFITYVTVINSSKAGHPWQVLPSTFWLWNDNTFKINAFYQKITHTSVNNRNPDLLVAAVLQLACRRTHAACVLVASEACRGHS